MAIIKKYKWLLIIILAVLVSAFLFFGRLCRSDIKIITDFLASYEKFDRAMTDFSMSLTDDSEEKANDFIIELETRSNFRISSLIKNDKKIMDQALKIAEFSRKEFNSLISYKNAIQSKDSNLDKLFQNYNDLSSQRKAAYVSFKKLGE